MCKCEVCFNKDDFKKIYNGVQLGYILVVLLKEYLERHLGDVEDVGELVLVLGCAQEKLGSVYMDFIQKDAGFR